MPPAAAMIDTRTLLVAAVWNTSDDNTSENEVMSSAPGSVRLEKDCMYGELRIAERNNASSGSTIARTK